MRNFSKILIIIGIILICIPAGAQIVYKYNNKNIESISTKKIETAIQEDIDIIEEGENIQLTKKTLAEVINEAVDEKEDNISHMDENNKKTNNKKEFIYLGNIVIKKINLDLKIVEGVEKSDLAVGAGHVPKTAGFGEEGNCVLLGHRSSSYNNFFRYIDKLKEGDEIIIKDKNGNEFVYIVSGSKVVKPEDVSVLLPAPGEYRLTLITCTPIYVSTHRLVVTANLKK